MIAKLRDKDNMWMKLIRVGLVIVLLCGLIMGLSSKAFAADDSAKEFSFYKISSAASMYYDDAHNAHSSNKDGNFTEIPMELAGNFVGFIDEDYGDGFIGSTVSFLSSSQQTRGYSSFAENGLRQYVEYGHALSALGLDTTANETFDFGAIIRVVAGLLLYLFYSLALVSDLFWSAAIKILQVFNPFAWFVQGVTALNGVFAQWFGTTSSSVPTPDGTVYEFAGFAGLQQFISGWYDKLFDLGLYLTAFLFFVTLAIALLTFNSQHGKVKTVLRTFVTRLLFICLGVPLLGGLYTATLDMAADSVDLSSKCPAANQVLMSTMIDFESWAANGDLALPNGTQLAVTLKGDLAGSVDASKSTPTRQLARIINNKWSPAGWWYNSSDFDWSVNLWGSRPEGSTISGAYDVIGRYMSNAFYHASDYETAYKKDFTMSANSQKSDAEREAFYATVDKYTGNYKEYKDNDAFLTPVDGSSVNKDSVYAPYMNDASAGSYGHEYTGDTTDYKEGQTLTFKGTSNGSGLSSLSMYNYLSTSFDDSSVVTYSAKKATSGMVVESHHSVNVIGDGAMSALYFLNMISMFFAISIIGIFYCFGVVMNMFGRGIKMVSSIPFAMLGNMRAMAKVCTIVAMMIIELLGTFFTYSLVIELLISLQGLVETPINAALSGQVHGVIGAGVPGVAVPITAAILVGTLLSTGFYFVFGLKAIKWRKSIIKALDEGAANVIDRLFTPNPNGGAMSNAGGAGARMASKPSVGERAANAGRAAGGAVMAGAGIAAGQMLGAKAGEKLGFGSSTAGTAEEVVKNGVAENSGGADAEDISDGGAIQGAERQGLPGSNQLLLSGDGPDGVDGGSPSGGSTGSGGSVGTDEQTGQNILAANAESLGDVDTSSPAPVIDASDDDNVYNNGTMSVDVDDEKPTATDAELSRMTGQTTAMQDEHDDEMKSQARKEAAKKGVEGAAQAVVGGAKVAGGYASGDVKMMADGAQDVAKGASKTAQAGHDAATAGQKVDEARAQQVSRQKEQEQRQKKLQGAQPSGSSAQQTGRSGNAGQSSGGQPSGSGAPGHTKVESSTKVGGAKSNIVHNGGVVNVNTPEGTSKGGAKPTKPTAQAKPKQPATQPQAAKSTKEPYFARRRAMLSQAEQQIRQTGKATLPNGKVVHNLADIRKMQRDTELLAKSAQQGITSATTVAALFAAKKLTSKKKETDDSFI